MNLLDLAQQDLKNYVSVEYCLELIARTQDTSLSYVALFLLNQGFETQVSTYSVDKYFIVNSEDNWNWGKFENTFSILSELYDDEFKEKTVFAIDSIPNYLKNAYWKRSDLYNLDILKKLHLDFYFRLEDIRKYVRFDSSNLEKFEVVDFFSDDDVRRLLKSCIPLFLTENGLEHNLIDDFVTSALNFFECDSEKGFRISARELKSLFLDNQIITKGVSNLYQEIELDFCKNIWDENYLSILKSDNNYEVDYLNFDEFCERNFNDIYPLNEDYPLFYKNETFTVQEAACLISGYDPISVDDKSSYIPWRNKNPKYVQAENWMHSLVRGGLFDEIYTDFYVIKSKKLKQYLLENREIIAGFNCDKFYETSKFMSIDDNKIIQADEELTKLRNEIEKLKSETKCFSHQALDEKSPNYAPELKLAIEAWEAKYIKNQFPHKEHTPAVTSFLKNQGYDNSRLIQRICAITNPKKNIKNQ